MRTTTEELIALTQITPPYDWTGWAETLGAIRALPTYRGRK